MEAPGTIDYHAGALAAAHPRRLIETLAMKTAVTLEKQILPDTECVAVHIEPRRVKQVPC